MPSSIPAIPPVNGTSKPGVMLALPSPIYRLGVKTILSNAGYERIMHIPDLMELPDLLGNASPTIVIMCCGWLSTRWKQRRQLADRLRWADRVLNVHAIAALEDTAADSSSPEIARHGLLAHFAQRCRCFTGSVVIPRNTNEHDLLATLSCLPATTSVFPSLSSHSDWKARNAYKPVERAHNTPNATLLDPQRKTRPPRRGPGNLTPRELDVVKLIATGYSNKEICNEMATSLETVKEHVTNILRRLGVRSRTQAAIWAIRETLV